jgi:hypothetical protein
MAEDKIVTGLASLAMILVAGAVFGRLHGAGETRNVAIGDRVMCGLLALPLIALGIRLAFPQSSFFWALHGPAPVLVYTVLLATTEEPPMSRFTRTLLMTVGVIYLAMVALLSWQA